MAMTHQLADTVLGEYLKGGATPHIWLHTGSPGTDGTANVAQTGVPANIVRKAVAFGDITNHPDNDERRVLSSGLVEWSGAEIAAAQEIQYFSIWSAASEGAVRFWAPVTTPKTTGSDGVSIAIGDLEVALEVALKPT